jgi:glutathione S-transferase
VTQPKLIVHGLDLSYFTGKLEAYLRAKGIAYELREMTTRSFQACGRATGFLQMPQVEMPDGTWLTDTTLIMRHLQSVHPEPRITPADPVARFISLLLEDFGDETLWRPALYFRWAFADDARLMSGRIARGMLRDVPLPFFLRRQFILRRQQGVYLRKDGVTPATRAAIEQLYAATLDAMEFALQHHPFVMGERPTEADFGLFGSMFRHFFSDPTPAKIMRERAPRTLAWVTRLWALSPSAFADAAPVESVPSTLAPLLRLAVTSHLPAMKAHADAVAAGAPVARFRDFGAEFAVPSSPYRAWCLNELRRAFQDLETGPREAVSALFADEGASAILAAPLSPGSFVPPTLPITAPPSGKTLDRNWR